MAIWVIRVGSSNEKYALDNGFAVIGWNSLPNLGNIETREDIMDLLKSNYPKYSQRTLNGWSRQIYEFRRRLNIGDLVVLPLTISSAIAIGKVIGTYEYRENNPAGTKHKIKVEWLKKEIPRYKLDNKLLSLLGGLMVFYEVTAKSAVEKINALL